MLISLRTKELCRTAFVLAIFISARLAAAQDKKDAVAVRDFNGAVVVYNGGLYDEAEKKWQQFLQKHPQDKRAERACHYLGVCQLHLKKFPQAANTFRTVLSKYPKFARRDEAQYNLGMALFQTATAGKQAAQFQAAAKEFGTVAAKYPTSKQAARALYFQGEALYSAKDLKGAANCYGQIVAKYPKSVLLADAYYALGTTQQDLGLTDDAVKTFQSFLANQALAQNPLASEIRLRLGMSLFDQKKFSEAEKLFAALQTVKDFPFADFAKLRLAQCQFEQKSFDDAVKTLNEFQQKFSKSPYRPAAQLALGKCYFLTEKFDQARQPLDEVIKANVPESGEAAYWLGQAFLKQDKPADALKVLEPAAQKYAGGQFGRHLAMARIDALYEQADRRKDSVALYEQFAAQNKEHELAPWALYKGALAALSEKQFSKARELADKYLGNNAYAEHQARPDVLFIAAESRSLDPVESEKQPVLDQARGFYQELLAKYPDHQRASRSAVRIGWCLYQTKQFDAAAKHLTASLAKLKTPEHKAEAHLLIGRSYGALGNHQQAVASLDAALKEKGDWQRADEVLIAAAQSLIALDNLDEARKRLDQLRSGFAESEFRPQALYQLAEIDRGKENLDEAIKAYAEFRSKYADSELNPLAGYGLAACYAAKTDFNNAISTLDQVLAKTPNDKVAPRALLLRGQCHQRAGHFDPAAKDLQAFLATKPEPAEAAEATLDLARCQIALKQPDAAAKALQQIIQQQPKFDQIDQVYYELAYVYLDLKKAAEAVTSFEKVTQLAPETVQAAEAWFHIGRAHDQAASAENIDKAQKAAELKKAEQAFAAGLKTAKRDELREKLAYKLGDTLYRQDQFAPAAEVLKQQIAQFPKGDYCGPATYLAAECLYRQDQFGEALPLYEQVVQRNVEKYLDRSLYRAGDCAAGVKNWPLSQRHYEELIRRFPKFPQIDDAVYGVGWALQNQNKLPEARAQYEKIASSSSEAAAKARFMMGEIAFTEKKYSEAIGNFLYVTVNYPFEHWQGMSHFEAGRCYMSLGKNEQAVGQFSTLTKKFPNHEKTEAAKKLITELQK